VKPASINLRKLVLSPTGLINLDFVLREDLLLCSSYLHDLSIVSSKKRPESDRANPTHTRWIPPQPGCVKLNMDTAMEKSTAGGAVGVVYSSVMGEFMGASALTMPGISDPFVMEALACREAMALAHDLNLQNITVETDCLSLITALEHPYAASFSKVLEEVKEDARLFSRASFRHENWASKSDAHRFARFSISSEVGCQVWLIQLLMVFVSSTEEWRSLKHVGACHQMSE
jgi:ribonuclease HI